MSFEAGKSKPMYFLSDLWDQRVPIVKVSETID